MESPVAAKNVSNVSSFMGREDAPLSPMLGSEDVALSLAATGRSIPVWPRARRARHRLSAHPAAHGTSTSCWAVRASARPLEAPTEAPGSPVALVVVMCGERVLVRPSLTLECRGLRGAA